MKLSCDHVELTAQSFRLFCDAGFKEGVHLIRGRTGSGKTTLASALANLNKPASGKILYEEIFGTPGFLMQFPEYQVTGKTVSEEIYSWNLSGTEEPFRLFGVENLSRDPLTLSRGELRRLELACVLAKEPDLLILDEPYASLDLRVKPVLTRVLEKRRGVTILFTHEEEFEPALSCHWEIRNGALHHA